MAGGGSSGKLDFPSDMKTQHKEWMDDIDTIIDAELLVGSPYDSETAYDPTTVISTLQTDVNDFESTIAGIDDEVEWNNFVDKSLSKIDKVLADSTALTEARTAFNNRSEDEFISGVNNLSTWAGGVGAVDSSAFSIGLALLEMTRQRKVDDFDADFMRFKGQFALQATDQMMRIFSLTISGEESATRMQQDVTTTEIIAQKEQSDRNIEMDVQDALWDIKLFEYGAHMMASIGSGVMVPNEPSPVASALSGAIAGGVTGGVPGAVLGGIGGLLGSIL